MTVREIVSAYAGEHGLLPRGSRILAAVSGGADSVCMLHLLMQLGDAMGFSVAAAHFNHRLRGGESDGDEEFVRSLCREWNVPFFSGSGDVAAAAAREKRGIEETARDMRYAFLREAASEAGADRIATAHTADDQAETVLMHLARGSGLAGVCGIAPLRGDLVRPLLCLRRSDVEAYLSAEGLPHREDSTNAGDGNLRNRLRHRVMPELEAVCPGFSGSVAAAAELLREDEAFLSGLARAHLEENCEDGVLSVPALASLPDPVAGRVIRLWWDRPLTAGHVRSALALVRDGSPSAELSLPGGVLRREYGKLLRGKPEPAEFAPVTLSGECGELLLPGADLRLRWDQGRLTPGIYKSFTTFFFKTSEICGKITVRRRQEGDALSSAGGGVRKTVKKRMIEARIPRDSRDRIPVVADGQGILAVYGLCRSDRALPESGDDVTILRFERLERENDDAE